MLEKEHIFLKKEEKNYNYELNDLSLAEMEKQHIKLVLEKVNWDKKNRNDSWYFKADTLC